MRIGHGGSQLIGIEKEGKYLIGVNLSGFLCPFPDRFHPTSSG